MHVHRAAHQQLQLLRTLLVAGERSVLKSQHGPSRTEQLRGTHHMSVHLDVELGFSDRWPQSYLVASTHLDGANELLRHEAACIYVSSRLTLSVRDRWLEGWKWSPKFNVLWPTLPQMQAIADWNLSWWQIPGACMVNICTYCWLLKWACHKPGSTKASREGHVWLVH